MTPNLPAVIPSLSAMDQALCSMDEKKTLIMERLAGRANARVVNVANRLLKFKEDTMNRIPEYKELAFMEKEIKKLFGMPDPQSIEERIKANRQAAADREASWAQQQAQALLAKSNDAARAADCNKTYARIAKMCHPDRVKHNLLANFVKEAKILRDALELEKLTSLHDLIKHHGTNVRAVLRIKNEERKRKASAQIREAMATIRESRNTLTRKSFKETKGDHNKVDISKETEQVRRDVLNLKLLYNDWCLRNQKPLRYPELTRLLPSQVS
jgi:hypothetical protein